jgi:hypothetical protein
VGARPPGQQSKRAVTSPYEKVPKRAKTHPVLKDR